jgi:hypothetical protein
MRRLAVVMPFLADVSREETDRNLMELGACANFSIERSESPFLLPEDCCPVK